MEQLLFYTFVILGIVYAIYKHYAKYTGGIYSEINPCIYHYIQGHIQEAYTISVLIHYYKYLHLSLNLSA